MSQPPTWRHPRGVIQVRSHSLQPVRVFDAAFDLVPLGELRNLVSDGDSENLLCQVLNGFVLREGS